MASDTKPGLVRILSDLVEFQSVSGQATATNACFEYLEKYLADHSMEVKTHSSGGFPSLFATSASQQPKILLQAHIDVVPAAEDLFKLTEKDGKLYGRGVYDMKFAAACYLQLVHELQAELKQYDFGIMLTSDEELGGENGSGMLLDRGYGASVCVLPDGGENWAIQTSCNGLWIAQLTANGQSAHGSRPWEGQNAITKLMDVLSEIRSIFGQPDNSKSTLTISEIKGGQAINQVPATASATLDMRFIDEKDYQDKRVTIETIIRAQGLELETVAHVEGCAVDITLPAVARFIDTAERIYKRPIGQTHSFGSSDARFFEERGIPTILMRPGGGGAHSDHEWIDKAGLLKYYEVIKAYVMETAKRP